VSYLETARRALLQRGATADAAARHAWSWDWPEDWRGYVVSPDEVPDSQRTYAQGIDARPERVALLLDRARTLRLLLHGLPPSRQRTALANSWFTVCRDAGWPYVHAAIAERGDPGGAQIHLEWSWVSVSGLHLEERAFRSWTEQLHCDFAREAECCPLRLPWGCGPGSVGVYGSAETGGVWTLACWTDPLEVGLRAVSHVWWNEYPGSGTGAEAPCTRTTN
jgi:hypothetical protein